MITRPAGLDTRRLTPTGLAELNAAAGLLVRVDRKYLVPLAAAQGLVDALAGAIKQAVAGNIVLTPKSSAVLSERLQPASPGSGSTIQPSFSRKEASPLPFGVTLSARELEVLALISEALTNKQIANRLNLSEATIKSHVSAIIAKLGVPDRVGAAVFAMQHGLVS